MKPPPFSVAFPGSRAEAQEILGRHQDEAKLIAGGLSLYPMMATRFARPAVLVDIDGLQDPGLRELKLGADGLTVGALVRHAELARRAREHGAPWRALPMAAACIGHYPHQVRGTVGGSVAHADPRAEWLIAAAALGAEVTLESGSGTRAMRVDEFVQGAFQTALQPDEMVVSVAFDAQSPASRSSFHEIARRPGDFAVLAACVSLTVAGGRVEAARIALGGGGLRPFRATAAEEALRGVAVERGERNQRGQRDLWKEPALFAAAEAGERSLDAGARLQRRIAAGLVERALRDAAGVSG